MYTKGTSEIIGEGITASESIEASKRIGPWLTLYPSKTDRYLGKGWYEAGELGRYANHSVSPNTECRIILGRAVLFASKKIEPGEEITVNYSWAYQLTGFKSKLINQ